MKSFSKCALYSTFTYFKQVEYDLLAKRAGSLFIMLIPMLNV